MIILLKKKSRSYKAAYSFKHFSSVYTIMMFISYSIHYMIVYYRTKKIKNLKKKMYSTNGFCYFERWCRYELCISYKSLSPKVVSRFSENVQHHNILQVVFYLINKNQRRSRALETVTPKPRTRLAAVRSRAAGHRAAGPACSPVRARCAGPTRNRPCIGCSCRSRSTGCNTCAIWLASGTRTTRTAGCSTRAATSRTPSTPAT